MGCGLNPLDSNGRTHSRSEWNINSSQTIFDKVRIVWKKKFEDVIDGNSGADTHQIFLHSVMPFYTIQSHNLMQVFLSPMMHLVHRMPTV